MRTAASPVTETVSCSRAIVATGLNATRSSRSSPLLIPPWMPPLRFVRVRTLPPSMWKASLCSEPFRRVPAKPEPISNPFEAGRLITARARSASSLSNTGSPRPAGIPRTTQVTTPPSESPSLRAASIAFTTRSESAAEGQRTMFDSTSS